MKKLILALIFMAVPAMMLLAATLTIEDGSFERSFEPTAVVDPTPVPEPQPEPQPTPEPTPEPEPPPEPDPIPQPEPPPVVGDLADTYIAQQAATLAPGDVSVIEKNPPTGGYRRSGGGAPSIDEWTSSNYWHPATRSTWFMGLRQANRFISYRADTNEWAEFSLDEVENAPPRFRQFGHMYERIALDAGRGHFYHLDGGIVYRYIIAENRWEKFPGSGLGGQVIEWNDDLDMLVNLNDWKLLGWKDGQVIELGDSPVNGYHSTLRYNRARNEMLMMGGNASRTIVAALKVDGTIEQKADFELGFNISGNDLTYDPLTGNYLVTYAKDLWEFDPGLDEWRKAAWNNGYPLHNYGRNVPAVIDELGVIFWQVNNQIVIHRHKTVFGSSSTTPPVQPLPTEPPSTGPGSGSGGGTTFPPTNPPPTEPPVVEPQVEPPVVGEPPEPIPGTLLVDQAATMQPGEWRNISDLTTWPGKETGRKFSSFQKVDYIDRSHGSYTVDGMGWTQTLGYHEGRLMLMLMRGSSRITALIAMEPDGTWWRINNLESITGGGRRPYNRLTQDDEYLYFLKGVSRAKVGLMVRTPLASPGVFEQYGVPIGDKQAAGNGTSAFIYVKEWGRFYAYTSEGKVWTWTHGEESWTRLEGPHRELSGYAGLLLWNPVKKELAIVGGQTFGSNPHIGNRVALLKEPRGVVERQPDMFYPDGSKLIYTAAQNKLIVDPRDGTYIQIGNFKKVYRNDTLGGTYEFVEPLGKDEGYPLGRYELYAPYAIVPGTDVIVFVSHLRGVVLHRLK